MNLETFINRICQVEIIVVKKKSSKQEKYVMICPRCKSPDISLDKSAPSQLLGVLPVYACNKCKNLAPMVLEVKLSELDELEEKVNEEHLSDKKEDSPLVDASRGNFAVCVLLEIIVLIIIGGLFLFLQLIL